MSSVLGSLRRAREWAYPQLTSSAFLEKGVLTPEEFVQAGDELVFRCPTWEWIGTNIVDPSKRKSYLPPNKQYLITRNVPCRNRVSSLETNLKMEIDNNGNGNGDGDGDGNGLDEWMVSSILAEGEQESAEEVNDNNNHKMNDDDSIEDDFDILDEDGEIIEKTKAINLKEDKEQEMEKEPSSNSSNNKNNDQNGDDDDDDEYCDMDDYEDEDILVDDDNAAAAAGGATDTDADNNTGTAAAKNNIIKTRTYDLSITYDKYYQVPRVWMIGRDEFDQPLTQKQMMEDVISDYANKTVTIEIHPHVSSNCQHASIHPCQHSKVMKAIVKNLIKGKCRNNGGDAAKDSKDDDLPSVEMYLFIFLKFVSSMIPTINYDFTMEVTADTSK